MKKIERKNLTEKILVKKESNSAQKILEKNKTLLIDESYMKNFINFDIKLQSKEIVSEKNLINLNKKNVEIEKSKEINSINNINNVIIEQEKKMEKLKLEFLENGQADLNLLKNEIFFLKSKIIFYETKTKFFEQIFFSSKNLIENFLISNEKNLTEIKKDLNNKIVNDLIELKYKLNCIYTQNNNFYYEFFNKENNKKNETIFSIQIIEKNIQELLIELNKFSSNGKNYNLQNLSNTIFSSLKNITSYYLLNDDYNFEFFNSNFNTNFLLEKKDEINQNLRLKKTVKEFEQICKNYSNKIFNAKFQNDLINFVRKISLFYENMNIILQNEVNNIKDNLNSFIENAKMKSSKLEKLIDLFIDNTRNIFEKIKQFNEIFYSKNITNKEKVLFNFAKSYENFFADLFEFYSEFNKNYYLIK